MRIALVSLMFHRAERARTLATALTRLGHEVAFVTSEQPGGPVPYRVETIAYTRAGQAARQALRVKTRPPAPSPSSGATPVTPPWGGTAWSRAVLFAESVIAHPDRYGAWVGAVKRYSKTSLARGAYDVVIAPTPPTSMMAGAEIAARTGALLIFDFQDLWTAGDYYPYGPLRRAIDRRREAALIGSADALVIPSESLRASFTARVNPPILEAIHIGVDPTPWRLPRSNRNSTLTFAHFGIVYEGRRDVRPLLRSISRLASQGELDPSKVRVLLVGDSDAATIDEAARLGLTQTLCVRDRIPPDDVPDVLAHTDVALLLVWSQDLVNLPLKTTHYLAAQKSILVLGADSRSEVARFLSPLPGTSIPQDEAALDAAVLSYYRAWDAGASLDWDEAARRFTWTDQAMAEEFLALIARASRSSRRRQDTSTRS